MSTHEIPEMKPELPPTGAHIPMETSLHAWQRIAEERLVGLEMWKTKAAKAEAAMQEMINVGDAADIEIDRLRERIKKAGVMLDQGYGRSSVSAFLRDTFTKTI